MTTLQTLQTIAKQFDAKTRTLHDLLYLPSYEAYGVAVDNWGHPYYPGGSAYWYTYGVDVSNAPDRVSLISVSYHIDEASIYHDPQVDLRLRDDQFLDLSHFREGSLPGDLSWITYSSASILAGTRQLTAPNAYVSYEGLAGLGVQANTSRNWTWVSKGNGVVDVIGKNLAGTNYADWLDGTYSNSAVMFRGLAGDDHLQGGNYDDLLVGGRGFDQIDGGAGNDTADFGDLPYAVTVDMSRVGDNGFGQLAFFAYGQAYGGFSEVDSLSDIENLRGTSWNDRLTGDAKDNMLLGLDGYDLLSGGGGDDTLSGGADSDTLDGGAGVDTADYSDAPLADGNGILARMAQGTVYTTRYASGWVASQTRFDTIANIENVAGTGNADAIFGDGNANRLEGAGGDDWLCGGAGNDVLDGGAGIDTADFSDLGQGVNASLSAGTATTSPGSIDTLFGIENLNGTAFNDTLAGDANDNVITAGAGNDLLQATEAQQRPGVRYVRIYHNDNSVVSPVALTELQVWSNGTNVAAGKMARSGSDLPQGGHYNLPAATDGQDLGGWWNGLSQGSNVAQAWGAAGEKVYIELDLGAVYAVDRISVYACATWLEQAQNLRVMVSEQPIDGSYETLSGDPAVACNDTSGPTIAAVAAVVSPPPTTADRFDGGDGIDTLDYSGSAPQDRAAQGRGVQVNLATGYANRWYASGSTFELLDSLANIENVVGTGSADVLTGDVQPNRLDGGAGNDRLSGAGGNDTLAGGLGNDTLDGGEGNNTADYSDVAPDGSSGLMARLDQGVVTIGPDQVDSLLNIQNLTATQNADAVYGNGASNRIDAGAGSDSVWGGGGNDTLVGGSGNDAYDGGTGIDLMDYGGLGQAVSASLATGMAVKGALGSDTLANIENLTGTDQDDTLVGDANANVLRGGAGNDLLRSSEAMRGRYIRIYHTNTAAVLSLTELEVWSGGTNVAAGKASIVGVDAPGIASSYYNSSTALTDGLDKGGRWNGRVGAGSNLAWVAGTAPYPEYIQLDLGAVYSIDQIKLYGRGDIPAESQALRVFVGQAPFAGGYSQLSGGDSSVLAFDSAGPAAGSAVALTPATSDRLDGGAGTDTADYSGLSGSVLVRLGLGTAIKQAGGTDSLVGIENVIGTAYNDTLAGDGNANVLSGGAGDDLLQAGEPSVRGRYIRLYHTNTTPNLSLTEWQVWSGGVNVAAGRSTDVGSDSATFQSWANSPAAATDGLSLGAGWNGLNGSASNLAWVATGAGDKGYLQIDLGAVYDLDKLVVYGRNDYNGSTLGETQNLRFVVSQNAISGTYASLAGDGTVTCIDSTGVSSVGGSATVAYVPLADRIDGGSGIDTVDYSGSLVAERAALGRGVNVNLGSGTADKWANTATGTLVIDTLTGIENVIGTAQQDILIGDANANTLDGGLGSDTYFIGANSGNDAIVDGGGSADRVNVGAASSQQLWFRHVNNDLVVNLLNSPDSFTVKNWYGGTANQIEQIHASDNKVLLSAQVDALVNAMAAYAMPTSGTISMLPNYATTLQPAMSAWS